MKETRKLLKMLKAAGFREERHNKHIALRSPDGVRVTISQNIRNASDMFQKITRGLPWKTVGGKACRLMAGN